MPCFDQPDLKASLSLTVYAPNHYEVISNGLVKHKRALQTNDTLLGFKDANQWSFVATPRISTYLYALCAGPFFKRTHAAARFPSNLYCR